MLYVSEVPLQSDERNVSRYACYREAATAPLRPYGTFTTPDGGFFRHHTPDHLRTLLDDHGFGIAEERTGTFPTLNGHTAESLQLLARRRAEV